MSLKTGPRTIEEYERLHADMIYHIKALQSRNDKLQARLDEAQAEIARMMVAA
jgi:chaperonin cofactor prefoldin